MKKSNLNSKKRVSVVVITLLLTCFAVLPALYAGPSPGTPPLLDVNVVNTPSVNVANTPTINVSTMPPVQVDSSANNPVLVRDVDNPARQPFTFSQSSSWSGTDHDISVSFTVPTGRRLVIEQVSVEAYLYAATNSNHLSAHVNTATGGTSSAYYINGTDAGQLAGLNSGFFVASSQMKSYADAGTTVEISAYRTDASYSDGNTISFSLSGYLVNVP